MFKNYFYLYRLAKELNELLAGVTIREVFTQEKDQLYLRIPYGENLYRHLVISTDQNFPFITVKEDHRKAKKNTTEFFEDYFPAKIDSVSICADDRILKFKLYNGELFFFIRGNNTNVLFANDEAVDVFKRFKKTDPEEVYSEISNKEYVSELQMDFAKLNDPENYDTQLKLYYPSVSKEIIRELNLRASGKDIACKTGVLQKILSEILVEKISCYFDNENMQPVFMPRTFTGAEQTGNFYDTYLEAINARVRLKYQTENKLVLEKDIAVFLRKQITFVTTKLNKLKKRIEKGCKDEKYHHLGNLLLANIHQIKKGQSQVGIFDYTTDENIIIKLDEKLSPQKNIDKYFEKSRDEKINFKKSVELYEDAKKQYDELTAVQNEFEESDTVDQLKVIADRLKLKKKKTGSSKKVEPQYKFKQYLIANKYTVYVGKDSKSNDYLSVKFAKQNDYWFHARGLPGSHVVLRVENTKEVVPKNIIKSAAAIAAFHSKAKTAGTAPVSYTFAKFVYKKKGMEPGQVLIQKEKVLLVKPQIPADVEFIEE